MILPPTSSVLSLYLLGFEEAVTCMKHNGRTVNVIFLDLAKACHVLVHPPDMLAEIYWKCHDNSLHWNRNPNPSHPSEINDEILHEKFSFSRKKRKHTQMLNRLSVSVLRSPVPRHMQPTFKRKWCRYKMITSEYAGLTDLCSWHGITLDIVLLMFPSRILIRN